MHDATTTIAVTTKARNYSETSSGCPDNYEGAHINPPYPSGSKLVLAGASTSSRGIIWGLMTQRGEHKRPHKRTTHTTA